MPPGAGLNRAGPINSRINKDAWVSKVTITDPSVKNSRVLEEALTLNILKFIREGNYFNSINFLTDNAKGDDLILSFQFDRYELKRTPHPAYFPLALITFTLYIWFGGPIYNDVSNLSGQITIKNKSGNVVSNISSKITEKHSVSLWSPQYAFPSGIKERTKFVKKLIDSSHAEIKHYGRN